MDNPLETIADVHGKPITVGTVVMGGDEDGRTIYGMVYDVWEGSVDMDDSIMRARYFHPTLWVAWRIQNRTEPFTAYWDNEGEGYGHAMNHVCEDLEVVTDG